MGTIRIVSWLSVLAWVANVAIGSPQEGNQEGSKESLAGNTITVLVAGGQTIEAVQVDRVGGLVHVKLKDGRLMAFSPEDIAWCETPERSAAPPDKAPEPPAAKSLRQLAADAHLQQTAIEITGELSELEPPSDAAPAETKSFEEIRDQALASLRNAAAQYSGVGRRSLANVSKYAEVCRGSMTAHGTVETTGGGEFVGGGTGAFVGLSAWGGPFVGVSDFTFSGITSWTETHELDAEIPNADSPFCRSLARDIAADFVALRPALLPLIKEAQFAGGLGAEIDEILTSQGHAPARFWME